MTSNPSGVKSGTEILVRYEDGTEAWQPYTPPGSEIPPMTRSDDKVGLSESPTPHAQEPPGSTAPR